jgi:iron complex transport system substrate-binding protein
MNPVTGNKQHRIVSLHPALTELCELFGLLEQVVGVGTGDEQRKLPKVSSPFGGKRRSTLAHFLSFDEVNLKQLAELLPNVVCTIAPPEVELGAPSSSVTNEIVVHINDVRAQLRGACENDTLKLLAYEPRRFEQIVEMILDLGRGLGVPAAGRDRAQRLKAQALDWGQNFYDRTKSKKVVVLSSIDPLLSAGLWVPDLISLASAHPLETNPGQEDRLIAWADLEAFRPDVIVIAPRGASFEAAAQLLPVLEKIPAWERLPAVKRGEVIFAPGTSLYHPGYGLVSGIAMLFSAIAGVESGYITERDSFHRLRYLELHRHRFIKKV